MKRTKNILVVAAHPDDEILGCGGIMALHAQMNHKVKVVIMAEGLTSRSDKRDLKLHKEDLKKLYASAKKANSRLGIKDVEIYDFPDNRMDTVPMIDVVKKIEAVIASFKPDIIYTHHFSDLNVDHQVIHRAVLTAARPLPGQKVKKIYFFEVPSSTDWSFSGVALGNGFFPNTFVDITSCIELKIKALKEYHSEMRPFPHARSIEAVEALAKWRGALSGFPSAEALVLGRELVSEID